jgi:ABC-type multidrug transport system permease subunit
MILQFISLLALQHQNNWGNAVLQAVIMFVVFAALVVALLLFMRGGKKKS